MALSYASRFPVKGLTLIAPARALEKSLSQAYSKFSFPLIIWGSRDNIISGEDVCKLASLLRNAKLVWFTRVRGIRLIPRSLTVSSGACWSFTLWGNNKGYGLAVTM